MRQKGALDQGWRIGIWRRFHPNGKLTDEGAYSGEKKAFECHRYNSNGSLLKTHMHKII